MANPAVIDPGISDWLGIVDLDWDYAPPECTWDGGYDWDDANIEWSNGLNVAGNFGFDLDYDLNNDGNWATCLLVNGDSASDADINALTWRQFNSAWDAAQQITQDSDNCKLRCRIYNRDLTAYSDYGYYGTFSIRLLPAPIFIGFAEGATYRWQAITGTSDYPQDLDKPILSSGRVESQTGRAQSVRHGDKRNSYELFFPALDLTDVENLKTFFLNIDFKKNPFMYRDKEVGKTDPFSGNWIGEWVKLDSAIIDISQDSTDYYSAVIRLRKTSERKGYLGG